MNLEPNDDCEMHNEPTKPQFHVIKKTMKKASLQQEVLKSH